MAFIQGTPENEILLGTDEDDFIFADAGNDRVEGGLGADLVFGGDGDDLILGGDGADTLFGDAGNDVLTGGAGGDSINDDGVGFNALLGGAGDDTISLGVGLEYDPASGDNIVDAGAGDDTIALFTGARSLIAGGAGYDVLTVGFTAFSTAPNIVVDLSAMWRGGVGILGASLATGIEVVTSIATGAGNDTVIVGADYRDPFGVLISTGAGNDILEGGSTNDVLDGGAGIDVMRGGRGDDQYFVSTGGDVVIENGSGGTDLVFSDAADYTLPTNVENLLVFGGLNGTGNNGANQITGNGADNTLSGLGGDDVIDGAQGNDTLNGGAGADTLIGGVFADVLTGGGGADRFVFRDGDFGFASPGDADRITDFRRSQGDKIDLSAIDADITGGADEAFAFIGTAAFTGVAGQLRYEIVSGRTQLSGDWDGDGAGDFTILLDGAPALVTSDFLL